MNSFTAGFGAELAKLAGMADFALLMRGRKFPAAGVTRVSGKAPALKAKDMAELIAAFGRKYPNMSLPLGVTRSNYKGLQQMVQG